jgi:hypothetical protein
LGQLIEVQPVRLGAVTIFDTDRSLSGQDGETYTRGEPIGSDTFPARLAGAVFESDAAVRAVFVYSNTVSIQRDGEWTGEAVDTIASAIKNFLIFYEDNREA